MGVFLLGYEPQDENERTGRVWPEGRNAVIRAILDVQNYLKSSGKYYRSARLITTEWPDTRRKLDNAYCRLTGHRLDHNIVKWSDGELQEMWEGVPKGYYKLRARDEAAISERPLFNETEGSCTIYAYTCFMGKVPNVRLVKIGYTRDMVNDYLRRQANCKDPKLLATMLGDECDEDIFKRMWRRRGRVAVGREYLWPEPDVFDWIVDTYDVLDSLFKERKAEAIESLRHRKP